MSKVRQGLREVGQARTLRARVWLVGLVLVCYWGTWWFWSESAADRFATAIAFLFAVLWVKDGTGRRRERSPAPEDPAPLAPGNPGP